MSPGTKVQPSVPLESNKEYRPPGLCAQAELHSAVHGQKKRTECPLGAQAKGLCSGTCQSRDTRFNFILITAVELRGSRSTVTSGVLHESI
jgi:hypothetical protein